VVHVPDGEARSTEALELQVAFERYFSYRANSLQSELKELFRVGRRSLAIGLTVLTPCLLSAHFLVKIFFDEPFRSLVEETF
jgi:hypothetical protein